jgi:hypothetical protein
VALVGVDGTQSHALDLISAIVKRAACPIIADIDSADDSFLKNAGRRGIFAYVKHGEQPEMEHAIDIVLNRGSQRDAAADCWYSGRSRRAVAVFGHSGLRLAYLLTGSAAGTGTSARVDSIACNTGPARQVGAARPLLASSTSGRLGTAGHRACRSPQRDVLRRLLLYHR